MSGAPFTAGQTVSVHTKREEICRAEVVDLDDLDGEKWPPRARHWWLRLRFPDNTVRAFRNTDGGKTWEPQAKAFSRKYGYVRITPTEGV